MGITRAREKLYLVNARQRMLYGTTNRNMPSRFLREIPEQVTEDVTVQSFRSHAGFTGAKVGQQTRKEQLRPQVRRRQDRQGCSGSYRRVTYAVGDTVRRQDLWHRRGAVYPAHGQRLPFSEVAFHRAGTKKLMANFARMEKV